MKLARYFVMLAGSIAIALFATASPGGERANAPSKVRTASPPVEAKKPAARFDPRDPKAYLDGVWSAMEELRSGVVRIREDFSRGGMRRQFELYYAFDSLSGDLRFDTRRGPSTFVPRWKGATYMQYARNHNEVLAHQGSKIGRPSWVIKYPREHDSWVGGTGPLQLRMLPVLHRALFRVRRPAKSTTEDVMRKFFRRLAETKPASAEFGKRITRFTWIMKSDDGQSEFRILLTFDRKQGNRLIKTEQSTRPLKGDTWRLGWRTETTWTQINKTWVAKKITATTTGVPAVSELSFGWESVNKPVPVTVFQMEGFALPKGTRIINFKTGKPVEEGIVK